jgi:hypothetical protein
MTVAVTLDHHGNGATLHNYFSLLDRLGVAHPGRHPNPACLFHWAAEIPGGFRITDVWHAQDEFEQFYRNIILPVAAGLGIPQPHHLQLLPIGNYLAGRDVGG